MAPSGTDSHGSTVRYRDPGGRRTKIPAEVIRMDANHESPDAPGRPRRDRLATLLTGIFIVLCLYPHWGRLRHPSLWSDDVLRVSELQTTPARAIFFRPFNEHIAPVFELVSWATWQLAGKRLIHAPWAFTFASLVPTLLCLAVLRRLVARECGSETTARVAVALFGISWVAIETAWWYSASSFAWALLGTLIAWLSVVEALHARSQRLRAAWWGLAVLSALPAPAGSGIGLLAGPVAALRVLTDVDASKRRWSTWASASAPIVGTGAYLLVVSFFRYRDVLANSVQRNADLTLGLLSVARAPIDVLLPGLLGLRNIDVWLPHGRDVILFFVGLAVVAVWAWRSRRRGMIAAGVALILGGYGLTYPFRTVHGPHWILEVERYHLFPQLGLVLVLAPALKRLLARWDDRPRASAFVAVAAAAILLVMHLPELRMRARAYHFAEQPRTLRALERVQNICEQQQITREQALNALDPIRTRWFDHEYNALSMLGVPAVKSPIPSEQVRAKLLASLTAAEREALCGGMDATKYLRPISASGELESVAVGSLVASYQMRPSAQAGRYEAWRGPAYLEYRLETPPARATAHELELCWDAAGKDQSVELWWASDGGKWSETRRVLLKADPTPRGSKWAIPLDRIPHLDAAHTRRYRVLLRKPGVIALEAPRLLR
jgi:hypothetical protein